MSEDELLDESRRAFAAGYQVAREEYVALLTRDALEARKQGFMTMIETLDFADEIPVGTDERAALIAAFKVGVVEQTKTLRSLMQHPRPSGKERADALAAPFGKDSQPGTASGGLPNPPPRAALENGKPEDMPTSNPSPRSSGSTPKKRGRPRKHPRPEPDRKESEGETLPADPFESQP